MLGTIVIIVCVVLLIILELKKNVKETKIPVVVASNPDREIRKSEKRLISNCIFFLEKYFLTNPKNSFIGRIDGDSMNARNIQDDDLVLGRKVNSIVEKFNKGDLLIIKITDESKKGVGKLKIREFKEYLDNGKIQTIKYIGDKPVESKPHKNEDVIAVVNRFYRSPKTLTKILVGV
jgi:SOS-response transcriptional repressor LexA